MRLLLLAMFGLCCCRPAWAAPAVPTDACGRAIVATEAQLRLPAGLLATIALVETGRPDPVTGRTAAWPWSIDANGKSLYLATKAEAIDAVQAQWKAGVRSIDVGCVQINLMYHPGAFGSLDEAFDPAANVAYGGRFLLALYHQLGSWPQAAAAYHSQTPDIGQSYGQRVMALWPLASKYPDSRLMARDGGIDYSRYTPQFAAALKEMHASLSRTTTTRETRACGGDLSQFTPAFAAQIRQTRAELMRLSAVGPAANPSCAPQRRPGLTAPIHQALYRERLTAR